MFEQRSRRSFLQRTIFTGAVSGGIGRFLSLPRSAKAGETAESGIVPLAPDIEPVVRLLEQTPRDQLLEAVGARIQKGLSYDDVLAALLLAGVRNVEPRPSVGYKFHAVLVVQSVHLASLAAPESDRWLPIFWALDYFKDSQARDEQQRGWTMGPVDQSKVPPANRAADAFVDAMDRWDEPAADAAVAALARTAKPADVWELFYRYGARDYRSIGHKAIDVANSHRVLGVIGWRHAEPVLRSLAYALLMHEDGNPAERDDWADRPGRRNEELARKIPDGWQDGKADHQATLDLVAAIREGTENDASDKVAELLGRGIGAQAIWDALLLGAGELLVRQPGIVALHSVTTTNSLYYAFRAAREDRTRRYILLQNAAFLPMFRRSMSGRGDVGEFAIDKLDQQETDENPQNAVDSIFAEVSGNRMAAARKTLGYFESDGPVEPWVSKARQLLIHKGNGAHDFKFACAVLEDADHISERWRGRFLGASVFSLQGSQQRDNPLVERTRKALSA